MYTIKSNCQLNNYINKYKCICNFNINVITYCLPTFGPPCTRWNDKIVDLEKTTWFYFDFRWLMADPGCGSRTRRRPTSPKRPRLGFRRSATTCTLLLLASLLPRPEPAGRLPLVIRREHHQHELPHHQSQTDHRHPPSIRRAPAGACGKYMLPVLDPYRGGDWGWRRLHWIDVSSTT